MKEKIRRILDLVRARKLTLDDAAPLLAALNSKLALQGSDRELIDSLLSRPELDTAQVAEHLLLLRGVKDTSTASPRKSRVPLPGFDEGWNWVGYADDNRADRTRQWQTRGVENMAEGFADRLENWADQLGERVEGFVDTTVEGHPSRARAAGGSQGGRILHIEVESAAGDEYNVNIPVSLAPHLQKLIPPHGIQALENAGFSLEALRLLIEADPPSGDLIDAEDSAGNEVHISIR